MVINNYNKKRHYELLKKKSLTRSSQEYSRELLRYSCMLEAHLDWQNREGYLKLLEQFQKEKIEDYKFCFAFEERGLLINDISDILKSHFILLSPQEKDNHFSSFVSLTIDICKNYIEEANENDKNSKIEFKNWMKDIYLQMQKILKEDHQTSFKDSTSFSELVDQLNWEIKDQYIDLLEEFLDESNNFLNVKKKYHSIVAVTKELESNSISLKLSYQALGFSNYLLILMKLFESYHINAEISPKVFKSWVQKILFEMKNHYC